MTILFQNLQITRSDIRPHIKWAVSLVTAYGHFNLPQGGLCGYVWVNILTLSPPRDWTNKTMEGREALGISLFIYPPPPKKKKKKESCLFLSLSLSHYITVDTRHPKYVKLSNQFTHNNKNAHRAQNSLAKAAHYHHIVRIPNLESQHCDPDHP